MEQVVDALAWAIFSLAIFCPWAEFLVRIIIFARGRHCFEVRFLFLELGALIGRAYLWRLGHHFLVWAILEKEELEFQISVGEGAR